MKYQDKRARVDWKHIRTARIPHRLVKVRHRYWNAKRKFNSTRAK